MSKSHAELQQELNDAALRLEHDWPLCRRYESQGNIDRVMKAAAALRAAPPAPTLPALVDEMKTLADGIRKLETFFDDLNQEYQQGFDAGISRATDLVEERLGVASERAAEISSLRGQAEAEGVAS